MRFISVILFLVLSQTTFAGIYELRFRRVAEEIEKNTCQNFIETTAKEFSAQTDARIIDFGCELDGFTLRAWDAVLTYQSPTRLIQTSNYTVSVYSEALYSDFELCKSRLEAQKAVFTKATGLQPLGAYCMLDVSSLRTSWATRVDGLGKPQLEPRAAGKTLWGSMVDAKTAFESYLSAASGYGFVMSEVGLTNGGLGTTLVVRFYASEPYQIDDYAMNYKDSAQCTVARDQVNAVLKPTNKPVVAFCETDQEKATLHATSFVPILSNGRIFKAKALTNQYTSLAGCQKAAESISSDADIYGAVCAGLGKDFRIHLFSRP